MSGVDVAHCVASLDAFKRADGQHQQQRDALLQQFEALLKEHQLLKILKTNSDASGDQKPFVMVAIDGDSYAFDDNLIGMGAEGGRQAATLLRDAVRKSIQKQGLDDCPIMVKVSANLARLSNRFDRMTGNNKGGRSVAAFAADFTRSNELFDFVHVGDSEGAAVFKTAGLVQHFLGIPQCRRIFFGGCTEPEYIPTITSNRGNLKKITLMNIPGSLPQYSQLGFETEDFSPIFTSASGPGSAQKPLPDVSQAWNALPQQVEAPQQQVPQQPPAQPQQAYQVPQSSGYKASRSQAPQPPPPQSYHPPRRQAYEPQQQAYQASVQAQVPAQASAFAVAVDTNAQGYESDSSASDPGHPFTVDPNVRQRQTYNPLNDVSVLPSPDSIAPGQIPVNMNGWRLDPLFPTPSIQDTLAYKDFRANKTFCNSFLALGRCIDADCSLPHEPVPEGIANAHRQFLYSRPCQRKGRCRRQQCQFGHVCQNANCAFRGGRIYCKFSPLNHRDSLEISGFEEAEDFDGPPQTSDPLNQDNSWGADSGTGGGWGNEGNTSGATTGGWGDTGDNGNTGSGGWGDAGNTGTAATGGWVDAGSTGGAATGGWDNSGAADGGWGTSTSAEPAPALAWAPQTENSGGATTGWGSVASNIGVASGWNTEPSAKSAAETASWEAPDNKNTTNGYGGRGANGISGGTANELNAQGSTASGGVANGWESQDKMGMNATTFGGTTAQPAAPAKQAPVSERSHAGGQKVSRSADWDGGAPPSFSGWGSGNPRNAAAPGFALKAARSARGSKGRASVGTDGNGGWGASPSGNTGGGWNDEPASATSAWSASNNRAAQTNQSGGWDNSANSPAQAKPSGGNGWVNDSAPPKSNYGWSNSVSSAQTARQASGGWDNTPKSQGNNSRDNSSNGNAASSQANNGWNSSPPAAKANSGWDNNAPNETNPEPNVSSNNSARGGWDNSGNRTVSSGWVNTSDNHPAPARNADGGDDMRRRNTNGQMTPAAGGWNNASSSQASAANNTAGASTGSWALPQQQAFSTSWDNGASPSTNTAVNW